MSYLKKFYKFSKDEKNKNLITLISLTIAVIIYFIVSAGFTEIIVQSLPQIIENQEFSINKENLFVVIFARFILNWILQKVDEKRSDIYEKIRNKEFEEEMKK